MLQRKRKEGSSETQSPHLSHEKALGPFTAYKVCKSRKHKIRGLKETDRIEGRKRGKLMERSGNGNQDK